MVVKIVHDELQVLLGEEDARIHFKKQGMTTVMMVVYRVLVKQQQVQRLRITARTN